MAKQNVALPSVDAIFALVRYDPATGDFFWRYPSGSEGRIPAGTLAGWIDSHGYRIIRIEGHNRKAHRLVWLIERGEPVPEQLDHINCVRHDNRIDNLRPATDGQQRWNEGVRKNNTSGVKGVSWLAKNRKWMAMICANGRQQYLGSFDTIEQAAAARAEAAKRLHGSFSNNG